MNLVELRGVTKSYWRGSRFGRRRRVDVLRGADLAIAQGECVALVGASGSGKSTLGRILIGVEAPDAGEVRYLGEPLLAGSRLSPVVRRRLQAVFQDPHGATDPRFSAFEVVAEPLRAMGLRGSMLRDRVGALLDAVGLDPVEAPRLAHRFSGGQLQRLCIARALAPKPRLILLDEAVSALDLEIQTRILALLADLRRRTGLAYLFITHDLRLVQGFADRCYVMDGGIAVECGDLAAPMREPPMLACLRAALLPARPAGARPPA
jgi:nickel transport system ATP-binding protein